MTAVSETLARQRHARLIEQHALPEAVGGIIRGGGRMQIGLRLASYFLLAQH